MRCHVRIIETRHAIIRGFDVARHVFLYLFLKGSA